MTDLVDLTFHRHLKAPPDRVFRAWTDPEEVAAWMGCGPDFEFRLELWEPWAGGRVRAWAGHEGSGATMEGTFLEVTPPTMLVYSWGPSTVTVNFTEKDGGTDLTVRFQCPPGWFGASADELASLQSRGWGQSLGRLEALLTQNLRP